MKTLNETYGCNHIFCIHPDNIILQGERNFIMQVVCEATQSPSVSVQVGAFECLVKIMTLYYEKMAFYMERALFGVRFHLHANTRDVYAFMIVDRDGNETLRRSYCSTSY